MSGLAAGIADQAVKVGFIKPFFSSIRRLGPVAMLSTLALAACTTAPQTGAGLTPADSAGLGAGRRPHLAVTEVASLKDMTGTQLVARLGSPDFTRRDPPAEIWQYRGVSCVLDVFLYPEADGLKVVHVASRDRARLAQPENKCTPFGGETRSASAE
jgi:hypothetical protein